MEKIIYLPVFFTATIKDWKPLLKPQKYKIIILQSLKQLVEDNKIILHAYCPDNYRDAESHSYYLADKRSYTNF